MPVPDPQEDCAGPFPRPVLGVRRCAPVPPRRLAGQSKRASSHAPRRRRLSPEQEAFYGVEYALLDDLLRRSDVVATFVPYARSRELVIQRHDKLSEEEGADDPRGVAKLVKKVRDDALSARRPTALCVHRPVLPHVLEALDIPPATLVTGEFLVAHLTADGTVQAVERHRPFA